MGEVLCPHCSELTPTGGLFTTCSRCRKVFETSKALPVPETSPALDGGTQLSGETFRLGPPPRAVPPAVRVHLIFGGVYGIIGWVFIAIGAPMFWLLAARADPADLLAYRGQTEVSTATVTTVTRTTWSEGNGSPRPQVYRYEFTFNAPDGRPVRGVSHIHGLRLEAGADCVVEYPPGRPGLARIQGMRRGIMPPLLAIPLSVHLVLGIAFAAHAARRGARAIRILAYGRPTMGVLADKRRGVGRVNGRQVYAMRFRYRADDGRQYETVAKTHEPEKLEDAAEERLVYDPQRPSDAVLIDVLPGPPRITASGRIEPSRPIASWCTLIPVELAVWAHLILGVWRMTS